MFLSGVLKKNKNYFLKNILFFNKKNKGFGVI